MVKRRLGMVGLPVLITGCQANRSPMTARSNPLDIAHSAAPRKSIARLFAGERGTCRLDAPGEPHCWGKVSSAMLAMARAEKAVELAFFGDEASRSGTYCVVNAAGRAKCNRACATGQPCGEPTTVEEVTAMHKIASSIVLIRRDGSACVLAEGAKVAVCGKGRLVSDSPDMDSLVPLANVSLGEAIGGYYDSLLLPDGIVCRLGLTEEGEFLCKHELVLPGGSVYEQYLSCTQGSDRCLPNLPLPPSERVVGMSLPFAVTEDGALWGPSGSTDEYDSLASEPPASTPLPGFSGIVRIAVSALHVCGVRANGELACAERWTPWGPFGARDASRTPHSMPPVGCVRQLVAGTDHICAQTCDDKTYCWGSNSDGQLAPLQTEVKRHELALTGVVQVSASDNHTCARLSDGSVWCWGDVGIHRMGTTVKGEARAEPVRVPLPAPASFVAGGDSASCAILSDGRVYCWGSNRNHAIAPDMTTDQLTPTVIDAARGASQIAMGSWHSCALVQGKAICWGSNHLGQLGLGHRSDVTNAVVVPGIADAIDLDVGNAKACAAMANGRVQCWGCFPGPPVNGATTFEVPGITDAVDVTVGDDLACARSATGAVWCGLSPTVTWGRVWRSGVQSIAAPAGSSYEGRCALMVDGTVDCVGKLSELNVLAELKQLEALHGLTLGYDHACGLTRRGRVICVGSDHTGQLGTGKLLVSGAPILVP